MASSYSTDLKLELMITGENAGTWGDKTNTNLNLVQQAIAGYEAVALSDGGTVALAMSDAALSNARNMILKFTGTLTTASTVTIPDGIEKFYIIDLSAVTGVTNLTIKTVSGTGFTAGEAAIVAAYSDGTNLNEIALNTLGGTIATAQIDDAAISTAKLSDNAVTTAKISNANVTGAKIAQSTITQAKLATDSVGPDQLISTGVTAAEYTSATITVDADGRITAASSGSAGAGMGILKVMSKGSASGSWTVNPSANFATAFMCSGGGGGAGGGRPNNLGPSGNGGAGAFGYYTSPATGGTPYPWSAGGLGNASPGSFTNTNPGNPGGSTGSPLFGTVNQGNGGIGATSPSTSPNGNTGTAPGALLTFPVNTDLMAEGGTPGARGNTGDNTPGNPGTPGGPGFIYIYDNAGV